MTRKNVFSDMNVGNFVRPGTKNPCGKVHERKAYGPVISD